MLSRDPGQLQISAAEFLSNPTLQQKGLVDQTVQAVQAAQDGSLAEPRILSVKLFGRSPGNAKLFVAYEQGGVQKEAEVYLPQNAFVFVKEIFEVASKKNDLTAVSDLASSSRLRLLASISWFQDLAQDASLRAEAKKERQTVAIAMAYSAGSSILLGEMNGVREQLRHVHDLLELEPGQGLKGRSCSVLMATVAPVIRAAAATQQVGKIDSLLAEVFAPSMTFPELPHSGDDIRELSEALHDIALTGRADVLKSTVVLFDNPHLQMGLLHGVLEHCLCFGRATSLKTLCDVAKSLLRDLKGEPEVMKSMFARIVRTFVAAYDGNLERAQQLLERLPEVARTDQTSLWLYGFVQGCNLRTGAIIDPLEVVSKIKSFVISSDSEPPVSFFVSEVARGMIAATQGAAHDSVIEIFDHLAQSASDEDGDRARLQALQQAHQFRHAELNGSQAALVDVLGSYRERCINKVEEGDEICVYMAEELASDIVLRSAALRGEVAQVIVGICNAPNDDFDRGLIRDILFAYGYEEEAIKINSNDLMPLGRDLVWRVRQYALELTASATLQEERMRELELELSTWGMSPGLSRSEGLPVTLEDWAAAIEELTAMRLDNVACKALTMAMPVIEYGSGQAHIMAQRALFEGLLRAR